MSQTNGDKPTTDQTKAAAPVETESAEEIHTSNEPGFSDKLKSLSSPLDKTLIKTRPGALDRGSNQRAQFEYVEWHVVADILDEKAPGWSNSIKDMKVLGEIVAVTVAITIDGVTREGVGTGSALSETGIKKAEHDALKRAAVKFGVARELYKKESDNIDRQASRFSNPEFDPDMPPQPIRAISQAGMVTGKQLGLIYAIGRESNIDVEGECTKRLACTIEELHKGAASWFIELLQRYESLQGQTQPRSSDNVVNMAGTAPVDHVSPATRGKLLFEQGNAVPTDDHFVVSDVIGRKECKFAVRHEENGPMTCECGEYKTAAFKGNSDYECAHKIAVGMFQKAAVQTR